MLAYVLAVLVGTGSVGLYAAAFFFPEIHRKHDFIWSGLGLFYALFLWIYAQQVTGGILVGQTTSVALLGWLGWQIFKLRRQVVPVDFQQSLSSSTKTATNKTTSARTENRTAKTTKTATPNSTTPTTATSPSDRASVAVKANPSRSNPSTAATPTAKTARPTAAGAANPVGTASPVENRTATSKPQASVNANPVGTASPVENRAATRPSAEFAPTPTRPTPANPAPDRARAANPQPAAPAVSEPLPVTIEVAVEPKRQSPPPQNQNPAPAAQPAQPTDNQAWIKLETSKPTASTPLGAAVQPPANTPTRPIADIPLPQSGDLDALLDEIETTVKQDVDRPQS